MVRLVRCPTLVVLPRTSPVQMAGLLFEASREQTNEGDQIDHLMLNVTKVA
jgi:hypothetical protein